MPFFSLLIYSLKTSLLKWKPDLDGAANEYQKASVAYKAARKLDKSIEYNLKAADCYSCQGAHYSAAKCYESAASSIGKELSDWDKAIGFFEKACMMYREHGVPDTAALCMDRAAKMLENAKPEKSAEFYATASDVSMIESKSHQSAEFAGKSARMYMKLGNLDEAAKQISIQYERLVEAEDRGSSGRVVVCLIIVHLARGDFVAAKKAFLDGRCFLEQQELFTCSTLIDAWDSSDHSKIISSLNHPFIKSLDNEITKLVRTLIQKQQENMALMNEPSIPAEGSDAVGNDAVASSLM